MANNRTIMNCILNNNLDSLNALLKANDQLDLTISIEEVAFYKNRQISVRGKPLFVALCLGKFDIARSILSYFRESAPLATEGLSIGDMQRYYTDNSLDPISAIGLFLRENPDQQDIAYAFIDELYDLLPPTFHHLNPSIFKLADRDVDIFTRLFFIRPKKLFSLLKNESFSTPSMEACIKHLLYLSATNNYPGLFDLLLEKGSNIDISSYLYIQGNSLLHGAVIGGNPHILLAILHKDITHAMLASKNDKNQTAFDLAAMNNNSLALVLMRLYQLDCKLHTILYDIAREKTQLAASSSWFSFLTPKSDRPAWIIMSEKLGSEIDFFERFFFGTDFSILSIEAEPKKFIQSVLEKIGQVKFTYIDGFQTQTTTLKCLLNNNMLNSSWDYLLKEVINRWQDQQSKQLPFIRP